VDPSDIQIIHDYPIAVLALRSAFREQRLGLILGAGVSRSFDFATGRPPSWSELITAIEVDLGVDSSSRVYGQLSLTQRVDVLFRLYLRTCEVDPDDLNEVAAATGRWRDIIRKHLYATAPSPSELLGRHPFLRAVLDLILQSPLTITYNFDSFIEEALAASPAPGSDDRRLFQRPYESVADTMVPQRRTRAVIYHINGYLPRNRLDTPSDQLVFSEEDFSTQLVNTTGGNYATVAHHLSNNVQLLIGLSLDDQNLRHLIRTSAMQNPGRVHFLIRHVDTELPVEQLEATDREIADTGFRLHNLYTLYLSPAQTHRLARLVTMTAEEFDRCAEAAGVVTKRVFYLSGIPGIGKTTVLRRIGGLQTLDEWVEEPHELLLRPHSDLTPGERTRLDQWIASQFRLKNETLRNLGEGIYFVERGPLDPLAFEHEDSVADKAAWYADQLEIGRHLLEPGHVILLHGDTSIVERRIARRQAQEQPATYLGGLQDQMRQLYESDAQGLSDWESTSWTIDELVRRVARSVYQSDYRAFGVHERLLELTS